MRITKQQAADNRARVVTEAARLFREKGFGGVGVAELMAAAGLTHGAFYNHFGSKDELEAAACARAYGEALERIAPLLEGDTDAKARNYQAYRKRYLSAASRDDEGARCPSVAFSGLVPRQSAETQAAFAAGFKAYLEAFERMSGLPRAQAIAAYAGLVGALALARSVAASDPALSDEILAAAR